MQRKHRRIRKKAGRHKKRKTQKFRHINRHNRYRYRRIICNSKKTHRLCFILKISIRLHNNRHCCRNPLQCNICFMAHTGNNIHNRTHSIRITRFKTNPPVIKNSKQKILPNNKQTRFGKQTNLRQNNLSQHTRNNKNPFLKKHLRIILFRKNRRFRNKQIHIQNNRIFNKQVIS